MVDPFGAKGEIMGFCGRHRSKIRLHITCSLIFDLGRLLVKSNLRDNILYGTRFAVMERGWVYISGAERVKPFTHNDTF